LWGQESPREVIEAYKVWKLTEALDLSEDQMPVFFAKLQKTEEELAESKQREREALRKMADLLASKEADEAELSRALAQYEEMKREHREQAERMRRDAASLLSVRQRCQYAVFEERFRNELREMISRVREMKATTRMEDRGQFGESGDRGSFGERGGTSRPGGSGKRGR
jgi:hypothetical protein